MNANPPNMWFYMSIEEFINQYFIQPIVTRTGYNSINTITYALIALVSLYIIHKELKKRAILIDSNFVKTALVFVLFGSTMRVVTDSIDNHSFVAATPLHEFVLSSGIYNYGFFTVTPGIYVIVALLFLASIFLSHALKKPEYGFFAGILLFLFHFILVLPVLKHLVLIVPIIILALIPAYIARNYFQKDARKGLYGLMVMGQALDGAATWISIDFGTVLTGISYFEQHVVSTFIGELIGTYITFYIVKCLLAFVIARMLSKEKLSENDHNLIALVIVIIGFAPGIRNTLRFIGGT